METIKINYNDEFLKELDLIKSKNYKPTLLLHVCCGPCFTYPYELLKDYFRITIFYNNSNIFPEAEYHRRLTELKKYLKAINADISIIEPPYDNDAYNVDLLPYADQKEGGDRCKICFAKRLEKTFGYASKNHFDYYGTVMSISRFKNSQILNEIGFEIAKNSPYTKWLPADFKKNGGYEKSFKIVKDFKIYFQDYCGCKFSIRRKIEEFK